MYFTIMISQRDLLDEPGQDLTDVFDGPHRVRQCHDAGGTQEE